ncbi:hypothetical protein CRYUN_Cryun40dG0023300 [Craigia yunnanensis]
MGLYPQSLRHPVGATGVNHRGLCLRGFVGSYQRAPPWKLWPLALFLLSPLHLVVALARLSPKAPCELGYT